MITESKPDYYEEGSFMYLHKMFRYNFPNTKLYSLQSSSAFIDSTQQEYNNHNHSI